MAHIGMAYIGMDCVVVTCLCMAYTVMYVVSAHIVMADTVTRWANRNIPYTVTAFIVMVRIILADVGMACVVTACINMT